MHLVWPFGDFLALLYILDDGEWQRGGLQKSEVPNCFP